MEEELKRPHLLPNRHDIFEVVGVWLIGEWIVYQLATKNSLGMSKFKILQERKSSQDRLHLDSGWLIYRDSINLAKNHFRLHCNKCSKKLKSMKIEIIKPRFIN